MNTLIAAGFFGGWEIVLILVVVLILFGAKKLPELAKGLGQGIKEFKKATTDVQNEITSAMDNPPPQRRIDPPQDPTSQERKEVSAQDHPSPERKDTNAPVARS